MRHAIDMSEVGRVIPNAPVGLGPLNNGTAG